MRDEPNDSEPTNKQDGGPWPFGAAIARYRSAAGLTQADLAELMAAQGVPWRREQVLRVEADHRAVSAHELLVLARVFRTPLSHLFIAAGYPDDSIATVIAEAHQVPEPAWPSDALRRASGPVLAYMRGDGLASHYVARVLRAWHTYETHSGRPPSPRAERAKQASLWREYEADPEGFTARATFRPEPKESE